MSRLGRKSGWDGEQKRATASSNVLETDSVLWPQELVETPPVPLAERSLLPELLAHGALSGPHVLGLGCFRRHIHSFLAT